MSVLLAPWPQHGGGEGSQVSGEEEDDVYQRNAPSSSTSASVAVIASWKGGVGGIPATNASSTWEM